MVQNNKVGQIVINIIMILLVAFCVIPFLLIVVSSFTDESTLMQNGYSFFPEKLSLEAVSYTHLQMLTVGLGEVLSCGVLGMIVYAVMDKYKAVIFK